MKRGEGKERSNFRREEEESLPGDAASDAVRGPSARRRLARAGRGGAGGGSGEF